MSAEVVTDVIKSAIGRVASVLPDGRRERGTGFLVSERYFLTCFHVVGDHRAFVQDREVVVADEVDFVPSGSRERLHGKVVQNDPQADWALVELETPILDRAPLPLARPQGREIEESRRFLTWGYPATLSPAQAGVVAQGHVKDWSATYLASAAIELHVDFAAASQHSLAGFSGAPCIVDGGVVGIMRATPVATVHAGGPAAIVGVPVGFIGAAESKEALAGFADTHGVDIPFVTIRGRRGGSAMAASALNALAQERE